MEPAEILFAGKEEFLDGLSNERELARACPKEFHKDNAWSEYAARLFFMGGNVKNWRWKTDDPEKRQRQYACFKGLLGTYGLMRKDKEAIGGWMLSEMLEEIPEYIPPTKKAD